MLLVLCRPRECFSNRATSFLAAEKTARAPPRVVMGVALGLPLLGRKCHGPVLSLKKMHVSIKYISYYVCGSSNIKTMLYVTYH